ncbi:hypothetical protein P9112_002906 [Eukaryota sp. TZLM1-RC]
MQSLLQKRRDTCAFLSDVHSKPVFWMNVVQLSPTSIMRAVPNEELQRRCFEFISLGQSLSLLLDLPIGLSFVCYLQQLIHEYEFYFFKNYTGVKAMTVSKPQCSVKPALKKEGSVVHLQCLHLTPASFELDYPTTAVSLFQVLKQTYSKLEESMNPETYGIIKRIDVIVQQRVFEKITHELTDISFKMLDQEVAKVQSFLIDCR